MFVFIEPLIKAIYLVLYSLENGAICLGLLSLENGADMFGFIEP